MYVLFKICRGEKMPRIVVENINASFSLLNAHDSHFNLVVY